MVRILEMVKKSNKRISYHHGNLAESLLDAVDEIATQFGLEAVTLRGCAKLVGVSPSSAFRHYADKRALLTAFAARALNELSEWMFAASDRARLEGTNPFRAVGLAYIEFALDKPAFFRAMWNEETIYSSDSAYIEAANQLSSHLKGGFANTIEDADRENFSSNELLAWSSVHGLANLFVDGPVATDKSKSEKMVMAGDMLKALSPVLESETNWGN